MFYQSHQTGHPVMRPLWFEFPQDTSTYASEDSFMVGKALLVCPVLAAGVNTMSVYLPGNEKYSIH